MARLKIVTAKSVLNYSHLGQQFGPRKISNGYLWELVVSYTDVEKIFRIVDVLEKDKSVLSCSKSW